MASENQDLEFECEIYGKPEPKITWLKNGERITLSAYWQIINGYVYIGNVLYFFFKSVKTKFKKKNNNKIFPFFHFQI